MKNRMTNIEALRILSMVMIVMLHLLNFGGFLSNSDYTSYSFNISWLFESFCFVAVNCYVLISGYFFVDSTFSLKRVLNIWVKTIVYSVVIYIIMLLFGVSRLNFDEMIRSFLPISTSLYWFSSVYVLLCFIFPFLNIIIKKINIHQYKFLLGFNFFTFSFLPIVLFKHYGINFGGAYSILWFINIYFIAGYIKLYFNIERYSLQRYMLIYLISSLILPLVNLLIKIISNGRYSGGFIYSYNSFIVLISYISLFCFFIKINITNKKINNIILKLSPLTFGVYLIHENRYIRQLLWNFIPKYTGVLFPFYLIVVVIIVYLSCSLIECFVFKLYKFIFNKLISIKRINKLNKYLSSVMEVNCD